MSTIIKRNLLLAVLAAAAAFMIAARPVQALMTARNFAWGEAPHGSPCHICDEATGEGCPAPGQDTMECLE